MLKMYHSRTSEQLEEGEIVDDDFEDISDNSIIEPICGKLVSSSRNLRALSLSSDNETVKTTTKRDKKPLRKRKVRSKKRKRVRLPSESSESEVPQSQELKGKLKEAIHISGLDGACKNTLQERLRLKAMGGLGPEIVPVAPTKDNADNADDKVDDNELENLRIEALKTAVLNKFERRKKKKALMDGGKEPVEILNDKENNTPKEETKTVSSKENEVKSNATDFEEDEDILRAALLAGLARKITKTDSTPMQQVKPAPPKLPIQVTRVLPKRPITNFKKKITNKTLPKPQVKPLIITVDDTDSEEESKQKAPKGPSKITDLNIIADNVEKFLKEQRVKFESEKKKLLIVNKNKEPNLEKSAVKLLPRSQQIEYQMLLKQLRTAERKKRLKKLAIQKLKEPPKSTEPAVEVAPKEVEVVVETAQTIVASVEVTSKDDGTKYDGKEQPNEDSDPDRKKFGIINELTTLQRTLKEMKTQRNGSLQIKSKYEALTPIIRKITATSNDRKRQEQRIKTLTKELNEAKNNLAKSHQRFTVLVRELVDKKANIDRSCEKTRQNGNIVKGGAKSRSETFAPVTSTPIKSQPIAVEEPTVSAIATSSMNNECEDMDVCNSNSDDMEFQIDIVDPNDIDQIFTRRPVAKSNIPEYVSPLNIGPYDRYRHVDPLGIMCPYEVNGSCRDNDCSFKHYLKSREKW